MCNGRRGAGIDGFYRHLAVFIREMLEDQHADSLQRSSRKTGATLYIGGKSGIYYNNGEQAEGTKNKKKSITCGLLECSAQEVLEYRFQKADFITAPEHTYIWHAEMSHTF